MHLKVGVLRQEWKASLCGRTANLWTTKPEFIANAVFVTTES